MSSTAAPPPSTGTYQAAPVERANLSQTIWVGNLAPDVQDEELAAFFAPLGSVVSAKVVRFGKRSLRYGFVEFTDEQVAIKATMLNEQTFKDRNIKVQRASPKPRVPRDPNTARPARRRRQRRTGTQTGTAPQSSAQGVAPPPGGRAPVQHYSQPPTPYPQSQYTVQPQYQGLVYTQPHQGQPGQVPAQGQGGQGPRRRRRRPNRSRRPRSSQDANAQPVQGSTTGAAPAPAAPRQRRVRQPVDNTGREQSDVLVFVANLPYSYDDEKLKNLFITTGANVVSAHAVRTQRGSAKGFGFVETASPADQAKALKLDHITVDERELAVKVAFKPRPVDPAQPAAVSP